MHFIRTRISALTILAAFGLGASTVRAQSLILHNGDAVTVDGTGTHGTLNHKPVNNKTTSYTSTSSTRGVDDDAVQLNGTSTFTLGSGGAITGGPNGYALEALGNSAVTVSGGIISSRRPSPALAPVSHGTAVLADGSSTITITGGKITGGPYGSALASEENGAIIVSGGTITGGPYGSALAPEGNGSMTVIGGVITAGKGGTGLMTGGSNGKINLFSLGGTPFLLNGVAMNNTFLAANSSGAIHGILLNGQPVDTNFLNGGHINLNVGKPSALRAHRRTVTR